MKKAYLESPLGTMLAAVNDESLVGLWFEGQRYFPADADQWEQEPTHPVFRKLSSWLESYFAGKDPAIDFAFAPCGTAYQQKVWRILQEIPYGQTSSYGAIARRIEEEKQDASLPRRRQHPGARAVGGAVGHNPISLVIPCHRVIGADKSLTGYAGGLDRKTSLLRLEGIL
jgi:methylated-DNA-[protein]-cysteine S-methyltransferase